jgi:hypothetical protein
MGLKFNPFSGNFDFTGSGGGGGGASYIDGEVALYADLSLDAGVAPLNTAWLVREASGAWLLARKPAGIYIRTATAGVSRDADYTYAGILPDVFNDANFLLYDNGDSSKNLAFQLSGITTGQTRTLTVPDASGTIALTSLVGASAELVIACSDEATNLTTGTAKVTFRMPYAMTLSSVRASVNTAPTGSTLIVDINEGGSTILSTKLSIDASELTSTTAATAAVISDTALADDAEVTIDIDQIGSTVAGKGLKVVLKGTRA